MALLETGIRNDSWNEGIMLKDDIIKYTKEGLKRSEMLRFLKREFAQYAWSLRSLDTRISTL